MRAIFISYRREDAEGQAGRLFNDLVKQFGKQSVFMDVAAIEPGRDFRKIIDQHVASCGVLLALIGKNWVDARDQTGRRRLDDPLDFVRFETAAALKRDIPVIPVLVHGAAMPRADQLPPDLAELAFRNAIELTHARWNSDLTVLVEALSRSVTASQADAGDRGKSAPTPPSPTPQRPIQRSVVMAVAVGAVLVSLAAGVSLLYEKPSAPQLQWRTAEFPPPNGGKLAVTIMPDGNPACASYDQRGCLWGAGVADLKANELKPLVCGEMHRAVWGETGYQDPKHWCSVAKFGPPASPPPPTPAISATGGGVAIGRDAIGSTINNAPNIMNAPNINNAPNIKNAPRSKAAD
jgi:hypothetical protein